MKSRTSFFDKHILRKDLTRFFPLWALYLIGGLLIMHTAAGFYDSYSGQLAYRLARDMTTYIGPMAVCNAMYAFLCAQLLFGDLHNTRLCNGLHAMPLRREGWYLTHTAAGLAMGLVPPLVIVLSLMPYLGQFWYVGLLCWGGIALHYLLFFGLGVLCMMCTGNRFAATACYTLLNSLALIVRWFSQTIYLPLLPGVRMNPDSFNRFCPVLDLVERDEFFHVDHLNSCVCYNNTILADPDLVHSYAFQGLGDDWLCLWLWAALGLALLGLSLVLYRRRHLERAGDFMVFKPMKPIFLTVYTMCAGAVLFLVGELFDGVTTGYVFFAIGLLLGYFTGKMLLERTVRVFRRRSFAGLGIVYAAVILSLLLTWLDPVGISRRVPDDSKVAQVHLYDGYLSDYQLSSQQKPTRGYTIDVTDPEDIAAICDIHSDMLQEHKSDPENGRYITLQYQLKNGRYLSRSYRIDLYGECWNKLKTYMSKPQYLFGATSLESLQSRVTYLYYDSLGEVPEALWDSLLEALWLDGQEGKLSYTGQFENYFNVQYVELRTQGDYRSIYFTSEAQHIKQWLETYKTSPQLILQHESLEQLMRATRYILADQLNLELNYADVQALLPLLWQDCMDGQVSVYDKYSIDGIVLQLETDTNWLTLFLDPKSDSAQWLTEQTKKH